MKKTLPLLLASLLAGCNLGGTAPTATALQQCDLLLHRFVLVSVDGTQVPSDAQSTRVPSIEFGEKMHVSGSMCNNFVGQGELQGNVLTVKNLAGTRMMCPDPLLNQWDQLIGVVLQNGAQISLQGNELRINGADHQLVYSRKDWVN